MTARRPPRPLLRAAAAGAVVAALAGALALGPGLAPDSPRVSGEAVSGTGFTDELAVVPSAHTGPVRAVEGLRAPTNHWTSGAVFGRTPQPVFTGVLAFQVRDDGFTAGLPRVTGSPSVIMGGHAPDLDLSLDAERVELSRVDDLSADFVFSRDGTTVGTLTAATGWPYLQYRAGTDQTLDLGADPRPVDGRERAGVVGAGGQDYLVVGGQARDSAVGLDAQEVIHLAALPDGATDAQIRALVDGAAVLTGTGTDHAVDAGSASTSFALRTGGQETLFAALPHQDFGPTADGAEPLRYDTVLGPVALHRGTSFTTTTEAVEPRADLDLGHLDGPRREELRAAVRADVAAQELTATDTYTFGKQLYRAANLHALATQLGMDEEADRLKAAVTAALEPWADPGRCAPGVSRCFVRDETLATVIGQDPAYGTELANDHHFHYGYFLYALGVLGREDPDWAGRFEPLGAALAADVADPTGEGLLPQRRSFDDWAGHSWASGTGDFADGNNQESTSEAVAAWTGLALWADSVADTTQAEQARWMLAFEVRTAQDYWLDPVWAPEQFEAPMVSLVWQGKRDYATWFDADPAAKIGIQVIPLAPSMAYLGADREHAGRLVAAALEGRDPAGVPLGDWIVGLRATYDPEGALEQVRSLPQDGLDPANSRSYLLAWCLSRA